jgi:hypothetical protein
MALIQPSKFLKIDYGMQGWTRLLDLNFHRLNSVLLKVPQLGDVYAPNGVQDKDILVWDATHERWVVTRFYDYFPLPTATGDVICTNLKISAADGYAFADFSAADILTGHVPYRSKLTITDSAGKKLVGYLKAAGEGESLGDEITTGTLDKGSCYKVEKEGRTSVFPTDKESGNVSVINNTGEIITGEDIGENTAWTYVLKVVAHASGKEYRTLICAGVDEANKSLRLYNGHLQANQEGTDQSAISTSVTTLDDGIEYELVATFDFNGDKKIHLYMDGEPLTLSTQQALIGALVTPESSEIQLGLDDATYGSEDITYKQAIVFNRALSAAEAADLYTNGIAESDKWGSQTPIFQDDFSSATGWVLQYGASISGGVLNFTAHESRGYIPEQPPTKSGQVHMIEYEVVANNLVGGAEFYYIGDNNNKITPANVLLPQTVGVHRVVLPGQTQGSRSVYPFFQLLGTVTSGALAIDNVKLFKLGAVLDLNPITVRTDQWYDASDNQHDATYSGGVTANIDEYFISNGTEECDADNTVKQVLEPDVDGVTITSTPDGEVYNWASVDEGFDFYDPAGYTYTIEGQVEP